MNFFTKGGPTSPRGFVAGSAACGLRDGPEDDLALLVSQGDCVAAGVFTRNKVAAAPVQIDRQTLAKHAERIRAVVANAGVANACTGPAGLEVARRTQSATADALGCDPEQVLLLSTGLIGAPLDLAKFESGLARACASLSAEGGPAAARAIMTTDTRPKHIALRTRLAGGEITLGGMAKGSGMIHPDMATLLAVITTDASVPHPQLQEMLARAAASTFNRISVDGDTSTNDSLLLLANGASGVGLTDDDVSSFQAALDTLCLKLAEAIVRDGEGASKFVRIHVTGAADDQEALMAARAIATSALVKTALAGSDPNWGRIVAAAGRSGADLDPTHLALWIGAGETADLQLVGSGAPTGYSEDQAGAIFANQEISIRLELGVGYGRGVYWTSDLTHDYVEINAAYHT